MTVTEISSKRKEFPLPQSCKIAIRIGQEWHTCNEPEGHEGLHRCKHYEWDNKEELFDAPMDKAQKVRFK